MTASETTALLEDSRPNEGQRRRTPLPLLQLAVLCFVRIADPLTFTFVFPFMNSMIDDLKVISNPSDVAFYAGLDGLFALAQFTTAFYWGSLSDRIGRRPVIFIGLSTTAFCVLALGLSKSLFMIVALRALAGVLLSNVAVIQSILGEITDSTNAALAIPLTAITWSVGCIVGPIIGSLHHPADGMPEWFGESEFHRAYPYFLPCFIVSCITLFAFLLSIFLLKESLPPKQHEEPTVDETDKLSLYGTLPLAIPEPPQQKLGTQYSAFDIMAIPAVQAVLACAFLLNILATSFDVLFVIASSSPISLGGLSRSSAQISFVLGIGALFSILVLPVIFAPMQSLLGTSRMYRYLMVLWPLTYAGLPLVNGIARLLTSYPQHRVGGEIGELSAGGSMLMWIATSFLVALPRAATMCLSLHILLFKSAAPSPDVLGSTFGLGQTVTCIARAVAPAFANSMYAMFGQPDFLGGQGIWLLMSTVGVIGIYTTCKLRD